MSIEDQFVCKTCEKVIRYERPLFCPYCGTKVDPVDGLEIQESEPSLYPWSKIAPTLLNILLVGLGLLFLVAWFWGKGGVAIFSLSLSVTLLVVFLISLKS